MGGANSKNSGETIYSSSGMIKCACLTVYVSLAYDVFIIIFIDNLPF